MITWSLSGEYFAIIILVVIALFYADVKPIRGQMKRYVLYWCNLGFCAASIFLNIFSVHIMDNVHDHSITLAHVVNTAYFLVSWLMVMCLCYYMFTRILEFVYTGNCMHRVNVLHTFLIIFSVVLLAINLHSGVIYYFDDEENYVRGPLNWLCYGVPFIEILMLIICYAKNRKNVSDATEKVLSVSIPIALILMLYEFIFPNAEMNGTIFATVNLIIFINYGGGHREMDSLTGLENRRYFMTETAFLMGSKKRFQMIFVKLHSLPEFGSIYGTAGSDVLLMRIGEALEKIDEQNGKVFRYGSSGFAMLYMDSDPVSYQKRLANTSLSMRHLFKSYADIGYISYSVIELYYTGQNWTIDDVHNYINDASQNCATHQISVMPFDEDLIRQRQRKDEVYRLLSTALDEKRFQVWYQPVYYLGTGRFSSAEALIRMYDNDGNLVFPTEFIPIAEETGILDDMTLFVIENCCRLLKSGMLPQLEAISVNFTVRQIVNEEFKRRVSLIMKRYEVKPEQIRIELTESDAGKCDDDIIASMYELKEKGYAFMLDDFGTGYSNVSRLVNLPLDFVKLDRSIVLLSEQNSEQFDLVKFHLVPLFIKLGSKIIAEGVETKEVSDKMATCGIDCIQGYYYAKPMPEHKLIAWYDEHC